MQLKKVLAGIAAASLAIGLAACSPSASNSSQKEGTDAHKNDSASCQNKVKKEGVEKVTVWAWYPAIEQIVDNFNETHDDVQVCWNNAGQGSPEYVKFQNAIKAGKGGPDIIQLEYEAMPQFVSGVQKHLVDLSKYGMDKYKSEYTEGAWNGVTVGGGSSVYGIPVDLGPFVMYVNQPVFDKYNLKIPTTWKEFAQVGRDLKAAGFDGYLSDWNPNGTAVNMALFAQKGAKPYTYSAEKADQVGIDFNSEGVQDVMEFWQGLVKEGLVDTTDANTTDWNTSMVSGKYALYVQASWLGGYLKGLDGSEQGIFRLAKAPVWDDSTPAVNQGGSAWAVTDQAANTKVAAQVAHDLFDSDKAQEIGVTTAGLFPAWDKMLKSDFFKNLEDPFFGNQKINEVTIPTAQAYKGEDFLPFQTYAYDAQTKAFTSIVRDGKDAKKGLADLTTSLNDYAKQQGFTTK